MGHRYTDIDHLHVRNGNVLYVDKAKFVPTRTFNASNVPSRQEGEVETGGFSQTISHV